MTTAIGSACIALLLCGAITAHAADRMRICLNWAPGADHAPLYYARSEGWFSDVDLAVDFQPGGGSADALNKIEDGTCDAAVADLASVLTGDPQHPVAVALMALATDSPLAFYAVAPTPLVGLADVLDRRVAAAERELPRRLWPELAQRNGIDATRLQWITRPNNAKVEALKQGATDFAANTFYHHHTEYQAAFGARLQVLWWRDFGVNPYGNVLAVSARRLQDSAPEVSRLVPVVQRALVACVRAGDPCVAALLAANPHLDADRERSKWAAFRSLLAPDRSAGRIAGAFESARLVEDARRAGLPPETLPARVKAHLLDATVRMPSR